MTIESCPKPRVGDTRYCPAGSDRIGVVVAVHIINGEYHTEIEWVTVH